MIWNDEYKKKLIQPNDWEKSAEALKQAGKSIATLNGSFDLMHSGHLEIIFQASQQAEILIVALNSDDSIKAYKALDRPIIPLEHRLKMMTALKFFDYVTWFHDLNPINFLKKVKPHVHVNGIEYGENCIESETVKRYGGDIYLVDHIPGQSTTEIINKIKNLS